MKHKTPRVDLGGLLEALAGDLEECEFRETEQGFQFWYEIQQELLGIAAKLSDAKVTAKEPLIPGTYRPQVPERFEYVITFYSSHDKGSGCDAWPEFFATRQKAVAFAKAEIARVKAIPFAERRPTIEWPVR